MSPLHVQVLHGSKLLQVVLLLNRFSFNLISVTHNLKGFHVQICHRGLVAEIHEEPQTSFSHYLGRALDRCLHLRSQTCLLILPKPSLLLWQFCFSWGLVRTSNSAYLKKKQFSLIPTNNRSEKV